VLASPTDEAAYCASLDALGDNFFAATGGRGVSLAVSSVEPPPPPAAPHRLPHLHHHHLRRTTPAHLHRVSPRQVTFHHLPSERMRHCVLEFVARVLRPRGTFVLRDWDNSHANLEVWYDVTHAWTPALPADSLPAAASALKLAPGTNYSSWATYEAQAAAAGLVLNATLQREQLRLMPSQMAEGDDAWPQRNFEALFSLSSPG
jgi:SAM-dependent methyltransferase